MSLLALSALPILLGNGLTSAPANPLTPGRSTMTMTVDGIERTYSVRVPRGATEGRRLPLVLLLHGFTGTGTLVEGYTRFGALADRENFFLVTPEGLGRPTGWNAGFINLGRAGVDDLKFLGQLLDDVVEEYPVDRNRVFVAGHSNGAMMANRLAAARPDRIAAISAVAGVIGVGRAQKTVMPKPTGRVNVLHIHGTDDRVVGYNDQSQALLVGVAAPDAVKWWAEGMGLPVKPTIQNGEGYETMTFSDRQTRVQLITLPGWRHDWPLLPAASIDATARSWEFFKANPKRQPVSSGPRPLPTEGRRSAGTPR